MLYQYKVFRIPFLISFGKHLFAEQREKLVSMRAHGAISYFPVFRCVRISIRGRVRRSVRRSVGRLVGNAFIKIAEKWPFTDSE